MFHGKLNWLGEKAAEARKARASAPSLEPLEPRVLLSADLADVPPDLACETTSVDPAIYADLNQQDSMGQQESSPVLTLDALDVTVAVDDGSNGPTLDNAASLSPMGAGVNEQPNQPTCSSPADGATGVSLTPTLESSDFSDPDIGDTHAASHWQVDDDSDFSSPVWDYEDTDSNRISQAVPIGTLLYNTTYYWRVRYQDGQGAWSEWSASRSFTTTSTASGLSPVFRFYSPVYSTHLYTMDDAERSDLIDNHADLWTYEGIAYCAFADDSQPVARAIYRFWSESQGQYFYTGNESERDKLINVYSHIWTYEGVAFYVIPVGVEIPGTSPVYRLWSSTRQSHFWTISAAEEAIFAASGWIYEGVAWYARRGAPFVGVDQLRTPDTSPQITGGVDDPAATIEVTLGGQTYAAVNNGDGTWTLADDQIAPALADGIYDVAARITDSSGRIATDTTTNELTIDTAVPVVEAGTDLLGDEGRTVNLIDASFSDASPINTHTATIDWGDGSLPAAGLVDQVAHTITGSHVYADNGTFTIAIVVTDDDGLSGSDTVTAAVNNVAPTIQARNDRTATQGRTIRLTVAEYNDLGTLDTHTATIDWGDGTTLDSGECDETPFGPPGAIYGMAGTINGSHAYTSAGIYTVVVTVVDDDSGPGQDTLAVAVLEDVDADGIASMEEQGPVGQDSDYDGNADGVPDAQQGHVASFHTVTGDYVTLAVPEGALLKNVSAIANPSPMDMPWEVGVPYGFLGFQVTNLTAGGAVVADLYVPEGSIVNSYYRYGPTPEDPTPHWYEFAFDGTTGAVAEGRVIHLHLVDGLRGDDDLTANGVVAVLGAPAEVNHPPGVDLANAMTALAENTDTSSRIKVADVVVTDDAFGINALSLSGANAGLFEIDGGVLYLKAGAALDHEMHPQLDVTVAVNDADVGADPDAAVSLSIGVADVNEPPGKPTSSLPGDGAAAVSLTPTLESSDFLDPDVGDTHAATQWQVDDNSDFSSPVWDYSDTDSDQTSEAVPFGALSYSATYYWRTRYQDSQGAWSEWSDARSFTVDRYSAVYRFWKASDNTHFYTISEGERDKLRNNYSNVYTYEGPAYYAYVKDQPPAGTLPVYRFWKASDNTHFYTAKEGEKDKLIRDYSHIYTYEGPAFYAYGTDEHPIDTLPVYRFWKWQGNTHFFTIKESEKDKLINLFPYVFTFENAVWYAYAG